MRKHIVIGLMVGTLSAVSAGVVFAQGASTPKGPNAEAAKVKNPVPADADSIARGKVAYEKKCQSCHKPDGAGGEGGDGENGPPAASLIATTLVHGQSDGEIHQIIKTGVLPSLYMPMYDGEIAEKDMWDITNYIQNVLRKKK